MECEYESADDRDVTVLTRRRKGTSIEQADTQSEKFTGGVHDEVRVTNDGGLHVLSHGRCARVTPRLGV
jgi:hypothetical protein